MRALVHRPFRLYFFGQAVSILGSWIQQVALAWLVYRLTGSAALLGLAAFAALAPILVVGPLAGASGLPSASVSPARSTASRIARDAPAPSGSGAVMWWESADMPIEANSA